MPTNGQRPISAFDTKQPSSRPPSTGTSSQDEWLETNTTGRPFAVSAALPITRTSSPSSRQTTDQ